MIFKLLENELNFLEKWYEYNYDLEAPLFFKVWKSFEKIYI